MLEFVLDAITLILILGLGIAAGKFFSIFTERAGIYLRKKMPEKVYSVVSLLISLLIIVLVMYKIIVG